MKIPHKWTIRLHHLSPPLVSTIRLHHLFPHPKGIINFGLSVILVVIAPVAIISSLLLLMGVMTVGVRILST